MCDELDGLANKFIERMKSKPDKQIVYEIIEQQDDVLDFIEDEGIAYLIKRLIDIADKENLCGHKSFTPDRNNKKKA